MHAPGQHEPTDPFPAKTTDEGQHREFERTGADLVRPGSRNRDPDTDLGDCFLATAMVPPRDSPQQRKHRWSWPIDEPLLDDPRSPLGHVLLTAAIVVTCGLLAILQPWQAG